MVVVLTQATFVCVNNYQMFLLYNYAMYCLIVLKYNCHQKFFQVVHITLKSVRVWLLIKDKSGA